MKDMQTEQSKKKSPKQNKGFYVALAVCIVAIAAAAWTTYGTVIEYSESQNKAQISELKQEESSNNVEAGQNVSDIPYEDSSEESKEESQVQESSTENLQQSTEPSVQPTAQIDKTVVQPVKEGKVIKKYSPENPVESKTMGDWRTHDGVDISADDGTIVQAITGGTVTEIENDVMYGTTVKIEHIGGYTVLYCGLSPTVTVKVGDDVTVGESIGAVYVVPCERLDESHLHLTVYKDGKLIDPESILPSFRSGANA